MVAGSGEMGVAPVSTVIFIFLFGRKAEKSLSFLFFVGEDSFLGEGISKGVKIWNLALVRCLETVTVGVLFFLL